LQGFRHTAVHSVVAAFDTVRHIYLFVNKLSLASRTDHHDCTPGTSCDYFRFRFVRLRRWHDRKWRMGRRRRSYDVIFCDVTWRTSDLDIRSHAIITRYNFIYLDALFPVWQFSGPHQISRIRSNCVNFKCVRKPTETGLDHAHKSSHWAE